jgi:hypothetical protein
MAVSATYYLNGPSLGSSTTIYLNSTLTTVAPNGFYSDGVTSREQVSGILLPAVTCGSCGTPCGESIVGSGNQGIYLLNLDAGSTVSDVGAIIVRFDPFSFPDGIRATYNGNVYNRLSSPVDGAHSSSNPLGFTIVGDSDSTGTCSSSWYPSGGNVVLDEFLYSGSSFSPTGETQTITIASGDLSLNTLSPGNCILVIPKVSASPNIVNFEIIGPCGGTAFDISIACPALLTGFSSSVVDSTLEDVCALSQTVTYYNASLANTPGIVGLYDFVFSDAYGASLLEAGFYKATGSIEGGNDWFEVDTNGVVIDMGLCEEPAVTYNCISGNCIDPGDGTGTYTTLLDCESNCGSSPAFSATMTVGGNSQFGYREGIYGSISNNNISTPAGANAVLRDLYWGGNTLAFTITNGSTTVQPNGWTTLGVGGNTYNRTSFSVSYNNPTNRWLYTLSTAINPFGTTIGATRAITLT